MFCGRLRLRPTIINRSRVRGRDRGTHRLNQSLLQSFTKQSTIASPCGTIDVASASSSFNSYNTLSRPCRSSTCSSSSSSNSNSRCFYSNTPPRAQAQKTALVLGSSGSLGSAIASQLKKYHDCVVIGSDIHQPSEDRVKCIDAFIHLHLPIDQISIDTTLRGLQDGISNLYSDNDGTAGSVELDAIICASGGFAMDEAGGETDDDDVDGNEGAVGNVYEDMLKMNYYPVVAAGEIAKQHMTASNPGLFVVVGAVAALSPAPGMVAYSSSKAAAHYYVQTLGAMTGKALRKEHKLQRDNELGMDIRRKNACFDSMTALALLPIMLNTKVNKEALPDEDYTSWTEPDDIAKEIGTWLDTPSIRPHSGSLVKVSTENNETEFILAR